MRTSPDSFQNGKRIALLVSLLGILACGSDTVTDVEEIINQTQTFEGKLVTLVGKYTSFSPIGITNSIIECEPCLYFVGGCTRSDAYKAYPSRWWIVIGSRYVGVVVRTSSGSINTNLPLYEEGQTVRLTGTVNPTTVVVSCITYESFYLEVEEDQIPYDEVIGNPDDCDPNEVLPIDCLEATEPKCVDGVWGCFPVDV